MENKKSVLKIVIKVVAFIAVLACLILILDNVLVRKDSRKKYYEFFKEAKEYDVLFTGISHMEVAVSPLDLYNDYGITSFNLGESGNILYTDFWTLTNALDYASPKLVVIDVRRLNLEEKALDNLSVAPLDNYPLSVNKIKTAMALYDDLDSRLEFLFHVLKYHGRWGELTQNDFRQMEFRTNKGSYEYEAWSLTAAVPPVFDEVVADDDKAYGSQLSEGALRNMIEMCQSRGIEVMLVELPYVAPPDDKRLSNGVVDLAAEYGINYLDFLHLDGIVNYDTDMNDTQGHVNDSGTKKATKYIGQYISEHYNLPDRREDTAYSHWNDDYNSFILYRDDRIKSMTELDKRLVVSADKNINTAIYVSKDTNALLDYRMRELINNLITFDSDEILCSEEVNEDVIYLIDNGNSTVRCIPVTDLLSIVFSGSTINLDYSSEAMFNVIDINGDNVFSSTASPELIMVSYDVMNNTYVEAAEFKLNSDSTVYGNKIN